jgi:hypothetical protein
MNKDDFLCTHRYGILEWDEETFEEASEISSNWYAERDEYEAEGLAAFIGEYVFHNRDGWESTWPLTARIWTTEGKLLGDFGIELEAEPTFYARKV